MPISENAHTTHVRAPVTDEELEQWATLRADDAGHLARELITYRRSPISTAQDPKWNDGAIPEDVKQAAYDCARGIYLGVDDNSSPYLTEDDICEIAKYIRAYAAPPPPAAVQEPVAGKALEWKPGDKNVLCAGDYEIVPWDCANSWRVKGVHFTYKWFPSLNEAVAAAEEHHALSTSQIDPAPEIAALRAENERLSKERDKLRSKLPARALTDQQLIEEMASLDARISLGFGEGGGSPGEWWYERADEVDHEQKTRVLEKRLEDHKRTAIDLQHGDVR
ncbi:hypothetical protein G6M02_07860 [Agrobacterium rhizogenes]|nr:hypothetical protein [Rhizobium rhizogenes]